MGWKIRKGRSYFYRSEGRGDRVVSKYIGPPCEFSEMVRQLDEAEAGVRREERALVREAHELAWAGDRAIREACDVAELAVSAMLAEAGIKRHRRGRWRRARAMSM